MLRKNLVFMVILLGFFLSGNVLSKDYNPEVSAMYTKGTEYYGYKAYRLALYEFQKVLSINPKYRNVKMYVKLINQSLELEQDSSYLSKKEGIFLKRGSIIELEHEIESFSRGENERSGLADQVSANTYERETSLEEELREVKKQNEVSLPVKKFLEEIALNKLKSKKEFPSANRIKELVLPNETVIDLESMGLVSRRELAEKNKIQELELVQRLNDCKKAQSEPEKRKQIIFKTLEDADFEMSLEYQFVSGDQIFKAIYSDGSPMSKLTYRIDGVMGYINAEARLSSKWSIGGRFGSSDLNNTTSRDEDWGAAIAPYVYQYTDQNTGSKMKNWEANVYYRFLDLDKDSLSNEFVDNLKLDRFYLDGFVGYQQQDGRYTMMDPMIEALYLDASGDWWTLSGLPLTLGLNSIFEVTYKGPRVGVRVGGSFTEKLSTKLSLSYAWIETKAHGYWNLRDYNFWFQGYNGSAINIDYEALYHLTPSWFIGAGIHYSKHTQKDLEAWGTLPASSFTDTDYIREVNNSIIGPSIKVGYRW